MKRSILALLILTVSVPAASAPRRHAVARPAPPPVLESIDAVAARALDRGVPGLVVALTTEDGALFERAYGVTNLSTRTPVETDTIFQVASVTKQFTAALVMKLVERGQLDLHSDVRSIIPELYTGKYTVTIEHLLTHTSGLPNYIEATIDPHELLTHEEVLLRLNLLPMRFEPGTRSEYNNSGYYVLGIIIERVSGVIYADFLEQELLHPLGLVESAYCGRPPAWPVPNGYVELGSLPPVPFEAMDMSIPFAAGALCSTGEDLVRWSKALHNGLVISQESYTAMTTSYLLESGEPAGYGYGIGVGSWHGLDVFSHSGGIPGFSSFLMSVPERGFTIAVLTNLFSTERGTAADIGREIAELFY